MTAPATHVAEAYKKDMDRPVQLFEITLKLTPTVLRFRNGPQITWQGNTYVEWPCNFAGDAQKTDGEASRPVLTIANPDGILSQYAEQGEFDLAIVVMKEVLQEHLLTNVNIKRQRTWFISKPLNVSRATISLQCHQTTDIPNYDVPGRFFSPPEFPFVVY